MPVLTIGNHQAGVPVKVTPSGLSCALLVVLTKDAGGTEIVSTSNQPVFTSTGSSQTVNASINIPSSASGTLYVFVDVYVNGILVGIFPQGSDNAIEIPGVTIGPIIWT
ncbi:MAG: hypothetical protein PHZ19_07760 [Candidatus Thermoplasmatota archaeon]|nr:hypothetical protein [Candidatus Thermoplasmatota archaeon]